MLIKCPECDNQISDKAIACPHCGYPLKKTTYNAPRKPKYKRLPNGFGNISKLSGNRRRPYAVYPPIKDYTITGSAVKRTAIGYYETYQQAYDALNEYNKNPFDTSKRNMTFSDLYEIWYNETYVANQKRTYSQSMISGVRSAYNNLRNLHEKPFVNLKTEDFQNEVDNCTLSHASIEKMVALIKNLSVYALQHDVVPKDYGQFVKIHIADDDEKGVPFTKEEIKKLWEHCDDKDAQITLLLIYSGFRVGELETINIDKAERYFKGGVKTRAGKNRIVPIHDYIFDYIDELKDFNSHTFRRKQFYPLMQRLGIETSSQGTKHTPHDCRHTFSWLCDIYGVDEFSKHLIMGHSLGNDVEKTVYGHRTIEDLKKEIDKITFKG